MTIASVVVDAASEQRDLGEEARLVLEDVHKSYGNVRALEGVSLELRPGEVLGVLGPNGAGKTTLASIVLGLVRPDAGSIRLNGADLLSGGPSMRRAIGYSPQELALYPTVSVLENLVFFGELAGLTRAPLQRRIQEVADVLQIGHLLSRRTRTLSGGEGRRVQTASALLHEPAVLIVDEPTAGVDVASRRFVLDAIAGLASRGSAVWYSTHNLDEVEAIGTRVAVMDAGKLIATGSVAELVKNYGGGAIELVFEGKAPAIRGALSREGSTVRVASPRPEYELTRILSRVRDASRLVSVEVIRPGLDAVFLSLTGRRLDGDAEVNADE